MRSDARPCAWCGEPASKNGKCRDCQREYMRQYRATQRGKERCAAAAKSSVQRRSARDPGYQARVTAAWRAAHPEQFRTQSRAYVARRRARMTGAQTDHFTSQDLHAYWESIGAGACVYCGADWEHADHVIPLSKGGAHSMENLVPACANCNLSKGARDVGEWLSSRR